VSLALEGRGGMTDGFVHINHTHAIRYSYQEDFYSYATLSLDPEELRLSVKKKLGIDWDPASVGEPLARQAVFVGLYDG
jgi:hypothetical protein